jgi:hypothetical protein
VEMMVTVVLESVSTAHVISQVPLVLVSLI